MTSSRIAIVATFLLSLDVLLMLCLQPTNASSSPPHRRAAFTTLGAGTGFDVWPNGSIPMLVEVTKPENKEKVSGVLAEAAAHIAARTCVRFYEVSAPTNTPYVSVKDSKEGSCSAGTYYTKGRPEIGRGTLNYDGCTHTPKRIVHEMLHILGISHEQKRIDSYDKLQANSSRIRPEFWSQYEVNRNAAYGEYDFHSIMHYTNTVLGLGNGPTFDSIWTGFRAGCKEMSDGDIATVNFVTQNCWKEPMMPQCRVSAPNGLVVGAQFDKNLSFTALYKSEFMTPTFTNMPEGATWHHAPKAFGSIHLVHLKPTSNDIGKNFTITATYTTSDGKSTSCSIEVQIVAADYVCNSIPSDDTKNTCSGHGACVSYDYPQCQCDPGYGGPFCEGTAQCQQDVVFNMDLDQEGRCFLPPGDELSRKINRVPGPRGEGYAANGTEVGLRFMQNMARQPIEVSALVRFSGGEEDGDHSVRFGVSRTRVTKRHVNGVYMDDRWHLMRTAIDWERRVHVEFIDGHYAGEGTVSASECTHLLHPDCAVDYVDAQTQGATSSIAIDRVRIGCAATHVTAWTSSLLSMENLMFHNISLMFLTAHASYVWNVDMLGDLCTATHPSILEGATFHLDPTDGRRMNVTLPQLPQTAILPLGLHYITCSPQPKHLTDSTLPLESGVDGQKVFAVESLCSAASGGSITYEYVGVKEWGHNPKVPDRVEWLNSTMPLLPGSSDWHFKLYNESRKAVLKAKLTLELNRLQLYNYSGYTTLYDDRLGQLSEANISLRIDWTTLATIGKPTAHLYVLDLHIAKEFTVGTLRNALLYYNANSPNGTVQFKYGCPANVEDAPRPAMWPGEFATEEPTTTEQFSSVAPVASATTQDAPPPSTPTEAVENTTVVSNAPPTAQGSLTTLAPTTTSDVPTTNIAASSPPSTPPLLVPTPSSPSSSSSTREYQVRFGGSAWPTVLAKDSEAVKTAARDDIAQLLRVSAAENVNILSVRLGSLVVDFAVTSDDAQEPHLANATKVVSSFLLPTEENQEDNISHNSTFEKLKAVYASAGGGTDDAQHLAVTSAVVVKDDDVVSSTTPTQAPLSLSPTSLPPTSPNKSVDSTSFSCSRGCLVMVVIGGVCIIVAAVVMVVASRRNGTSSAATLDVKDNNGSRRNRGKKKIDPYMFSGDAAV